MLLIGRAKAAPSNSPILIDTEAVEIAKKLDINFEELDQKLHEANEFMPIARARDVHDFIRQHLEAHPSAIVVNLGAGLDTAYYRVDNGFLNWIDVGLFLISTGVLAYLAKTEVKSLFSKLADSFPESELAFNIQSQMTTAFGNPHWRRRDHQVGKRHRDSNGSTRARLSRKKPLFHFAKKGVG
jgi:O-methyltransferase involved in polyketide biosynthesis